MENSQGLDPALPRQGEVSLGEPGGSLPSRSLAWIGAILSVLLGIPWLAVVSLGSILLGTPYPPFDLFEWLAGQLPGALVTVGIETLVGLVSSAGLGPTSQVGKTVEILLAFVLFLVLFAVLGAALAVIFRRMRASRYAAGLIAGLVLTLLSVLPTVSSGQDLRDLPMGFAWLLAACLVWGAAFSFSISSVSSSLSHEQDQGRRRLFGSLAASALAVTLAALGIDRWLEASQSASISAAEIPELPTPVPMPSAQPAAAGFVQVPGLRPEITPIEDFYRVDINLLPPGQRDVTNSASNLAERLAIEGETDLPASSYLLVVDGLVQNRLALDLPALQAFPSQEQYATLECISNPVGGDLIGTTLFNGVRLKDVLEQAGLQPGAKDIKLTCVDGYTESLSIASAIDPRTLLCYAMGGQPLSEKHGAPIRLYTPNRFGMKNPKWIILIEAVGEDYLGYWEQRRWSEQAWVQTTSVIDSTDPSGGQVQVGGIAFAGDRGISAVEIQADQGDWLPATLNRPLSPLTWVLWSATLQLSPGQHRLTVRAVDGDGSIQTAQTAPTHPDGATGHHSREVEV